VFSTFLFFTSVLHKNAKQYTLKYIGLERAKTLWKTLLKMKVQGIKNEGKDCKTVKHQRVNYLIKSLTLYNLIMSSSQARVIEL
jgi:hypothetical protein